MAKLSKEKFCEKCDLSCIKRSSCFTYLDIRNDLHNLLFNYHDNITSYIDKERNFIDLIDGEYYKKIRKNGYVNLLIYTDGIQLIKSKSLQFWPVLLSICELPPKLRDSVKNKLIIGVWLGKVKPSSDILFESLKNQLEKINEDGIIVQKNGNAINYKLSLYGVICDSPAKAIVMNMNQFNGYYGCPYCLNPGS